SCTGPGLSTGMQLRPKRGLDVFGYLGMSWTIESSTQICSAKVRILQSSSLTCPDCLLGTRRGYGVKVLQINQNDTLGLYRWGSWEIRKSEGSNSRRTLHKLGSDRRKTGRHRHASTWRTPTS